MTTRMTQERELDVLLDAFFVDGTNELADRVLDAALDQIDHTRQRRREAVLRRFTTMSMPVRLAAAAVIGALAIGGVFVLLRPFSTSVGTLPTLIPSTPPASAGQPSPSASSRVGWTATGSLAGDAHSMVKIGKTAPTENVAAEARAACRGRAMNLSERPSSSRAWAPSASRAINCSATVRASAGSRPR